MKDVVKLFKTPPVNVVNAFWISCSCLLVSSWSSQVPLAVLPLPKCSEHTLGPRKWWDLVSSTSEYSTPVVSVIISQGWRHASHLEPATSSKHVQLKSTSSLIVGLSWNENLEWKQLIPLWNWPRDIEFAKRKHISTVMSLDQDCWYSSVCRTALDKAAIRCQRKLLFNSYCTGAFLIMMLFRSSVGIFVCHHIGCVAVLAGMQCAEPQLGRQRVCSGFAGGPGQNVWWIRCSFSLLSGSNAAG